MFDKLSRRNILKLMTGGIFSTFKLLNADNKRSSTMFKKGKNMSGIINMVNLPEVGPWPTRDPFLFCVHHNDIYPRAKEDLTPDANLNDRNIGQDFSDKDGWSMYHGNKIPGFPKHPHRGFETLTIVDKGIIDHSDSLGASARYGDGDAQWLTAGDGINHAEMFPLFDKHKSNPIDFFQIWINLPSINKRVPPHFSMFWKKDIPKIKFKVSQNIITEIEVIAGDYNLKEAPKPPPHSWAKNKKNDVAVWVARIDKNGVWDIPVTKNDTLRSLYVSKGNNISINNQKISPGNRIDLIPNLDIRVQNNGPRTKLLLLQGQPIKEPVVQYGPFVMNSKAEIQEAFDDYNQTKFGEWNWESSAPVHGNKREKFAKLIDGATERPS